MGEVVGCRFRLLDLEERDPGHYGPRSEKAFRLHGPVEQGPLRRNFYEPPPSSPFH